jgi:uncharacterized membrane protein YgcG
MRTRFGASAVNSAFALAIFCVLAGLSRPALAAPEPSGRALAVDPEADALRDGSATMLAPDQPVYMGDRVRTGPNGKAQLEFSDQTKMVVGPSSNLLIERYLLKNSNTVKSFSVTALRGTFRFITGDSPKPAYAIRTPSATIGIRGTEFDLTVQPDGSTEMVLLSGAVRVCGGGGCISVGDRCSLIRVPRSGSPAVAGPAERLARIQAAFPYVNNQNSLKPSFQASTQGCAPTIESRRDSRAPQVQPPTPVSAKPPPPPPPPPPAPPAPPACDGPKGKRGEETRGDDGRGSRRQGGSSQRDGGSFGAQSSGGATSGGDPSSGGASEGGQSSSGGAPGGGAASGDGGRDGKSGGRRNGRNG